MFKSRSVLFKLPKHRTFEYQPRYYDPEKEELEKRVKLAKLQAETDQIIQNPEQFEASKVRIAKSFKDAKAESGINRRKEVMSSRFRLFAIILFLMFITYWYLG